MSVRSRIDAANVPYRAWASPVIMPFWPLVATGPEVCVVGFRRPFLPLTSYGRSSRRHVQVVVQGGPETHACPRCGKGGTSWSAPTSCTGAAVVRDDPARREWPVNAVDQGRGRRMLDVVPAPGYIPHRSPGQGTTSQVKQRGPAGNSAAIRFLRSSMVEHSAVNRRVVGSSPTGGAIVSNCYLSIH
jgi:hypothetical protein